MVGDNVFCYLCCFVADYLTLRVENAENVTFVWAEIKLFQRGFFQA